MDIEERIRNSLAEKMQKTVDYDVLCDVLVHFGWTEIVIDYYGNDQTWINVRKWVDENCIGQHREHQGKWLFELEKDAVLFKLRWA